MEEELSAEVVEVEGDDALDDLQNFFAEIGEDETIRYKLCRIERGKTREWLEEWGFQIQRSQYVQLLGNPRRFVLGKQDSLEMERR